LHVIGEDTSEMLDLVPAQLRVKVIRRPRYGCRACEEAVVQAPAPERPITGGMATEALLAHVLVAKFSDHLPLYRQAQIFARQGIALDRSTFCDWVGRACWWLEPLPIALGRKNSLFAGSDGGARHWAIVASLVATAKLNGVEPQAWLTDVLERMVSGRTKAHELEQLLPWAWKAKRLPATVEI
jgi:transposase